MDHLCTKSVLAFLNEGSGKGSHFHTNSQRHLIVWIVGFRILGISKLGFHRTELLPGYMCNL